MAKILIVRLGAMGDIIHALPAVTGIRAALPEATIGWLVEERWTELLAAAGESWALGPASNKKPVVNVIHTVNTQRWRSRFFRPETMGEIWRTTRLLRDSRYDFALDFQGAIKSALFGSLSGPRIKAGFIDPRESAARFFYSAKYPRSGEHVIEQNYALAKQALQEERLTFSAPLLPVDLGAEAWAANEIKRLGIASFAIMNPGAGWGAKQWPPERFGRVAQALAVHNLKTLINAAPGEEMLAQRVAESSNGHAFVVGGSVGQLISLTRRARLFIGGDTGPLHLAAALEVPCVGLFGPTDPARTGPFGTKAVALRHSESKTTFSHHAAPDEGLLKISVEEVISAARWLLGGAHA